MTFGEKLQKLRKERGWTQEQLAEKINVSRQALSRWELGAAVPDTENVLQISRLFGVSTDYLLHDEYENDGDIPAVRTANASASARRRAHTLTVAGAILAGFSALGLVVLGILGSAVFPVDYTLFDGSGRHEYTGFSGFLVSYRLVWLFVLLCVLLAAGLILLFWPWASARRRRDNPVQKAPQ